MKKLIFSVFLLVIVSAMVVQAQSQDTSRRRGGGGREGMVAVATADIPAAIQQTLKGSDYDGWTVSTVTRNSESTRFRVELTKSSEKKTAWFDKDGKAIVRHRPQ